MRFAIIYYKKNIAGKNIADQFRSLGFTPQVPIIELDKETIYSEINYKKYPNLRNVDFLFFASTHRSKKGDPSLCLHVAGNWRSADLGGREGKVCITSAHIMKYLFKKLEENAKKDKEVYDRYKISMEATHHGPLVDIPSCFIELGSLEEEWNDKQAAKVIAKTIMSLENFDLSKIEDNWIPCIGIGGGHYCLNFNKIQLNSNLAISHIIPEYNFPVTETMIKEAEEKTKEQIKLALVDWKSMKSEERQKILAILDKIGLEYERTSKVSKEKTN